MLGADTENWLNLLRVAICLLILGYSCLTDWRSRRAPNRLWYLMGGLGLALGAVELYLRSSPFGWDTRFILAWAISFIFIFVLMYGLYYFFQYFGMTGIGGADAKALIAIGLLFPYYPQVDLAGMWFPLTDVTRSIVFGLAVFGNALALNLTVVVAILLLNILTVPFAELAANPVMAFTGYKSKIESLKGKHVRLMHRYKENNGVLEQKRSFGGAEMDDDTYNSLLKWKAEGKVPEKVWVTPKIPFLIPITLGFIVAVVWGDILTQIISLILFR